MISLPSLHFCLNFKINLDPDLHASLPGSMVNLRASIPISTGMRVSIMSIAREPISKKHPHLVRRPLLRFLRKRPIRLVHRSTASRALARRTSLKSGRLFLALFVIHHRHRHCDCHQTSPRTGYDPGAGTAQFGVFRLLDRLVICLFACKVCLVTETASRIQLVNAMAISIPIFWNYPRYEHQGPRVPPHTDRSSRRRTSGVRKEEGERYREVAVERMRGREKEIGGKSTARSRRKNEDHMRARKKKSVGLTITINPPKNA
jgi:hypothetical protein